MNNDPFNPLLPSGFTMNAQPDPAGVQGKAGAGTTAHQENTQTRNTTRPRRARSAKGSSKKNCSSRWDRIKGRFTAKLVAIDPERLKRVLLACGIAVGAALAIAAMIKLVPLAVTILALLGVAMALEVWNRVRRFPQPPF